jgi:hypothetical protein
MKTYLVCAFVIAVFLVSNGAYGEVVVDEGVDIEDYSGGGSTSGDAWSHSASAYALEDEPYSGAYGAGHVNYITTEAGYFSWSCNGAASGVAAVSLQSPASSVWAAAGGSAGLSGPSGSPGVAAYAHVALSGDSGYDSDADEPPDVSMGGYDYFSAFSGVAACHGAWAGAGVTTPSGASANGEGSAVGACSM